MRTDASGKFEKGLDPNTAEEAINRACQLIEELGAGEVVGGMIDIYAEKPVESRVAFRAGKDQPASGNGNCARRLCLEYFKAVDLAYDEAANEVVAPTWRQDIHCMADLAEEVARFYGYDKIRDDASNGRSHNRKAVL